MSQSYGQLFGPNNFQTAVRNRGGRVEALGRRVVKEADEVDILTDGKTWLFPQS